MVSFFRKLFGAHPISPQSRRQRQRPASINRYYLTGDVITATEKLMRRYGKEERECYVWWGGYCTSDGDAQIVSAILPEVTTQFGRVHLSSAQLSKLHAKLRELDQILLVELHTHPGGSGQNEVDAAHPAAIYPGFVTVVVPDFCKSGIGELSAHFYQYQNNKCWNALSRQEINDRFIIEPSFVSVPL